jgi:thiosulfate dehydrogenase [quinone] large subunit
VPVGGAESFTDPATGEPAYVLQLAAGQFTARSAICTHQGCTVGFSQPDLTFVCPCHGSVYDARSGRVLQGPAPSPLPSIKVAEGADGNLYVDGQ